jgi:hypothetical protein
MSRPQKIHKPIKGGFNQLLTIIATGSGAGKKAVLKLAREKKRHKSEPTQPTPKPA